MARASDKIAGEADFGAGSMSVAEYLPEQFAEWEARGRGWLLWGQPVRPEPPFAPFPGYRLPLLSDVDDGRQHTLLSGFIQWLSRKLTGASAAQPEALQDDEPCETLDDIGARSEVSSELQVTLPLDSKVHEGVAERFLVGLGACRRSLSFEVIGLSDQVVLQFACDRKDESHLRAQVEAHFPDSVVASREGFLESEWGRLDSAATVVVEFGLSREFMLPLAQDRRGDLLVGLAGTLGQVGEGELAMLQVVFEPVRHPWAASTLRAVATPDGEGLFGGLVNLLDGAKSKIMQPLYAAVVRVAVRADSARRAWELARRVGHSLDALADPMGNELIALEPGDGDEAVVANDVPLRRSRRSGMILGVGELAAIVHLPGPDVRTEKFRGRAGRTKAAPACVTGRAWVLGVNDHAGEARRVTLDRDQRVRHMHVIGASGTGKSTLLQNLILQDLAAGEGLALLDPHGDLVDDILARIPPHREGDVVLFDPADEEFPVGFNILAAHTEAEKTMLASDLVGVFRRLSTSWGDQMNAVLGNGVLAFLESDRGGTLADLRRFLVEPKYREHFLATVRDPQIAYYWRKEFPLLVGRPQGPVLTRLDAFLRPKGIRHVVAQRANRLDFADIMDGGKVFLARLAHGAMGEENAHLLGALLVSKFHQIALGRQRVDEGSRRHFWLYVDEFQHFATPSMASLLSGVRKYRLGLVLAHQELHQLESRSPDVASAVSGNAHTRICFRVGDHDARKLESGFTSFTADDLQSLGIGEAICRVERSDQDFNLRTPPLPSVDAAQGAATRQRVVASSREKYASDRREVEEQLRAAIEAPVTGPPDPAAPPDTTPPTRSPPPKQKPPPPAASAAPREPPQVIPPAPAPSLAPAPAPAPSPSAPRRSTAAPAPTPIADMGRGGPEHRYLQQLIKQWGDGMGYRATIEKPILDGSGSVDVALEKPGRAVACQVSVTTSAAWEADNVRKCLAAKFSPVVVVAADAKRLAKLRKEIEPSLPEADRATVRYFTPEALFAHLQELDVAELKSEKLIRGYRVKKSHAAPSAADGAQRRQTVSRIVAEALKRRKPKK